ncbi:MAG TPA: hypothetical protein VLR69_01945 [Thermoanaerobaculia bacterium]|nr:hypothetical protein [Thermoanaerobaculia bacterium]
MSAWAQLLRLPLVSFVYGLEFMVQSLRAMQQTAQQIAVASEPFNPIGAVPRGGATTTLKETGKMSNCSCGDQCGKQFCEVRVYDYYIVSVKPCHERIVLNPTSIVITSDMSGEAFTAYVTALYCQDHKLPPEEIKYLRVCYRISCTFPKERESCSSYAREQVEILREIRNAIGGGLAAA